MEKIFAIFLSNKGLIPLLQKKTTVKMDKVHEQKAHSKEITEKRMLKVIHNQINENEKDLHFSTYQIDILKVC